MKLPLLRAIKAFFCFTNMLLIVWQRCPNENNFTTISRTMLVNQENLCRIRFSLSLPYVKKNLEAFFLTSSIYRVSQWQLFFSNAYCSHKNDPISKISLRLSCQWIEFYVGAIYSNINWFAKWKNLLKVIGFIFSYM